MPASSTAETGNAPPSMIGRIKTQVGNVDRLVGRQHASHRHIRPDLKCGAAAPSVEVSRRQIAVHRGGAPAVALPQPHGAVACLAEPRGIREHGTKHRRELAGRAGDDLQHFRGRGLLLQRFAQVGGALLLGLEQPDILDRDHCLIGEGRQQRNMLVVKRTHFGASYENSTKGARLDELRVRQGVRAMSVLDRVLHPEWEFVRGARQIRHMNHPHIADRSARPRAAVYPERFICPAAHAADGSADPHRAIFGEDNVGDLRLTDARGVLRNRFEHWVNIARRIRDDAQNLADRRLLFQCFVALAGSPLAVPPASRPWIRVRSALCEAWRGDALPAVRFHHVAACRPLWRSTAMRNPIEIPSFALWHELGVIEGCPPLIVPNMCWMRWPSREDRLRPRRHSEWAANLLVDNGSNFVIFSECALILQANERGRH